MIYRLSIVLSIMTSWAIASNTPMDSASVSYGYLWVIIGLSSLVAGTLRLLPALVNKVNRLHDYPKIIKFLDYSICMITGEIIYVMAFGDIARDQFFWPILGAMVATLLLGIILMHYTDCLTKSFLYGLLFCVALVGFILFG